MQQPNNKAIDAALDLLEKSGKPLSNLFQENGLLKQLTKGLVERALQAEIKDYLGYDRHQRSTASNARNGTTKKSLITEHGPLEITVPRDRSGDFEPELIPKRVTRIEGLDDKIISLYAKGMSVKDIQIQLQELYGGAEISTGLISKITNEVLDEVQIWQNRPLEAIYPVVFFDCLVVKVRQDKRIINKSVYVALGIDMSGKKDVLGLWISENEGAKFWLNNLTEMKNRGLRDMLIACTDNLTGMSDAISAVFPKKAHQLCIVHQIRNSLQYVSYKDRKKVAADLRLIYTAINEEEALSSLEALTQKWEKQYPHIGKSWYANWDKLVVFLEYPPEIRKIIYTTNPIESLNSQLRKVTKNKRIFPSDDSVFKTLFLAIEYICKKWTLPVRNWNKAMAHFMIKFDGRI